MASDKMEVDAAEAKLKAMEHSEQHYFKRCVSHVSAQLARGAESLLQEYTNACALPSYDHHGKRRHEPAAV